MEIDYDRLREDLINYYGSATPIMDVFYAEVIEIETASESELKKIAIEACQKVIDAFCPIG